MDVTSKGMSVHGLLKLLMLQQGCQNESSSEWQVAQLPKPATHDQFRGLAGPPSDIFYFQRTIFGW